MYAIMGRFECFVGADYVIRTKSRGLTARTGISGGKEYELHALGYLFQLSVQSSNQLKKPSSV